MDNNRKYTTTQDESGSEDLQATPSRAELEQHVRTRAWKDETFRQEFLANPKALLERDYAQWFPEGKIPAELSIKTIVEEEQAICFVLPPRGLEPLPEMDDLEEEELADVTGGIHTARCSANCPSIGCTVNCSAGCSNTACPLCGNDLIRGSFHR